MTVLDPPGHALVCKTCHAEFSVPKRPGRYPAKCTACRIPVAARPAARATPAAATGEAGEVLEVLRIVGDGARLREVARLAKRDEPTTLRILRQLEDQGLARVWGYGPIREGRA